MITPAEATAHVLATVRPLLPELVPLLAANGRVLRQNLLADRDFPPFDRVAMDGVALRFEALQAGQRSFPVERAQLAGQPPVPLLDPQAAIEIMTGAALPPGTDTVVRYEDLHLTETNGIRTATVQTPPPQAGHHVHRQATDGRAGELLIGRSTCLGPAEIAVAAAVGAATLAVTRLARLAVVGTGDEVVPLDQPPLPYQVRRSNAPMLQAALAAAGASADAFHFNDDPAALRLGLPALLASYDAVLLSGGVSKGQADFLPQVLRALGVDEVFHRVAQRPGMPFWFGRVPGGAVVFALPGNPVSTFVNYYRYVQPWLRGCQGRAAPPPRFAVLAAPVEFKPRLAYFLPVKLENAPDGRLLAHPAPTGGSGDLAGLLAADGLLELPAQPTHFAAGEAFAVWRFR